MNNKEMKTRDDEVFWQLWQELRDGTVDPADLDLDRAEMTALDEGELGAVSGGGHNPPAAGLRTQVQKGIDDRLERGEPLTDAQRQLARRLGAGYD